MLKKLATALLFLVIFADVAIPCVGKTIYVGYVDSVNEEILGNILSRLILERTGTTVKLKKFSNPVTLLQGSVNGEIDLFVFSEEQVKKATNLSDKEKSKSEFSVKHNLVWLKPLIADKQDFLVPIIRKDTLKKFPALPKLIEKLDGQINTAILNNLNSQLTKKKMKDLVKDFLKEKNLI